MMNPENRTLYVGNLDINVTEDLIRVLFSQLGEIRNCKMFRDPASDPYCFIEFADHVVAVNAITMMNEKNLQGKKMKVHWATGNQGAKPKYVKVDTSNHFHIYAGDLSPDIDEQALREAFSVFGDISDCKIVRDPQNGKSRGYGFVVFVKKVDADTAIASMNGQWLGRRMIKVRWATRKVNAIPLGPDNRKLTYNEVFEQTSAANTTAFIGGLKSDCTEEVIKDYFSPFGQIEKIKLFKDKGYSFIKYVKKEDATNAIVDLHCTSIQGQIVRCSWGKDNYNQFGGSEENPDGIPPIPPEMFDSQSSNGGGMVMNDQQQMMQQQQMAGGYYPCYPQQMSYNPNMGYNQQQFYGYPNPGIQPANSGYMWMGPGGWGQQAPQQNFNGQTLQKADNK